MTGVSIYAVVFVAFLAGVLVGEGLDSGESSPSSVSGLLAAQRESVREDYEVGRVTLERFEDELDLLDDPRTERVMHAVSGVEGVGPKTALAVARRYRSLDELEAATVEELTSVNGVGENRAGAIAERSFA